MVEYYVYVSEYVSETKTVTISHYRDLWNESFLLFFLFLVLFWSPTEDIKENYIKDFTVIYSFKDVLEIICMEG